MARHDLDAFVDDGAAEVTGTGLAVTRIDNHLAATVEHVASHIVDVGASDAARTTHYDVVGGVDAVAAGAVGTEQVVPTVAIEEVGGFAVDGDVELLVALDTSTCGGIELNEANGAEVGAVAHPKASGGGVEEKSWVDSILIFHTVGGTDFDSFGIFEVGRLGVERCVPHGEDASVMAAAKTSACSSIDDKVTVTNLEHVGCGTSTWAYATAVP